jgi:hypothetical protein
MNRVTGAPLTKAPRLRTAYLATRNGGPRALRPYLLAALALPTALIAIVCLYPQDLHRHALLLAGLAAFVACVLVARRRSLQRTQASRSWTAALPVPSSIARWETLLIEVAPALAMAGALILAFAIANMWVTSAIFTGLEITAGIVLGTLVSLCMPAPKVVDLPPGSRYVPHRRGVKAPVPQGSLSALGMWPLRQMFASARPKAVARATLPMLLIIPLGATADSALLVLAMLGVTGALLLLVSATMAVGARAARWVRPLPLSDGVLLRILLGRTLAVMFCAAVVAGWLLWVMGTPVARSGIIGALTAAASSLIAVVGCRLAILRTLKGRR